MRLGDLSGIAITFVVLAVTLGIGATILDSVQSGQTSGGAAYNATQEGLDSMGEFSDWLPTLATRTEVDAWFIADSSSSRCDWSDFFLLHE